MALTVALLHGIHNKKFITPALQEMPIIRLKHLMQKGKVFRVRALVLTCAACGLILPQDSWKEMGIAILELYPTTQAAMVRAVLHQQFLKVQVISQLTRAWVR